MILYIHRVRTLGVTDFRTVSTRTVSQTLGKSLSTYGTTGTGVVCSAEVYGYHILLENRSYLLMIGLCASIARIYGDREELAERIYRGFQYEGR